MTGDVLAIRYASALIEIAEEDKSQDKVGSQLADFTKACENSELKKILLDPSCSVEDKTAVVAQIADKLKLDVTLRNFAMVLVENKRIGSIAAINDAFQALYDERAGRVKAEVFIPFEAGKNEEDEIRKGLEKATGKQVVMDVKIDPDLIGGVVARVGGIIYDGSIRTQLENIKNNIMRG